jgi:Flp pilus assembly protein TadG
MLLSRRTWRGHRPRAQSGQVLILFIMGATVIFVIGAIVVDIGLWVTERRNAQAAADLAALAAATQLHDSVDPNAAATAKGLEYAQRNGYDPVDPDIDVRVQPDVSAETVQVEIEENGGSLFAGIFGITSMSVGATAVASYSAGAAGPDLALFANSTNCNPGQTLDIQAGHLTVTGSIHSNATIHVEGPDDQLTGPITYACPGGFSEAPQQNYNYPQPPRLVGTQSPPLDLAWTQVEPYCDGITLGDLVITDPSPWLNKVVCTTGDLTLNTSGTTGRMTLAAQGKVTISGAGDNLQPADSLAGSGLDRLLVYSASAGDPAIEMTLDAGTYTGYIHAPNSRVIFNGLQNVALNGAIVGHTVVISGSNLTFTALPASLPGPPGPPEIQLID